MTAIIERHEYFFFINLSLRGGFLKYLDFIRILNFFNLKFIEKWKKT